MADSAHEETTLKGLGVSPGIAIGSVFLFEKAEYGEDGIRQLTTDEIPEVIDRFKSAVTQSEKELNRIADVAEGKIGSKPAEIFRAKAMMLRDPALYDEVIRLVTAEKISAAHAVKQVLQTYKERLEKSSDTYLRDRSADLDDLQQRLLRNLRRGSIISKIPDYAIVIAENLTAADVILFSRRKLLGCATSFGGLTSHVALIARALGIPSVFSLHDVTGAVRTGETVILDGLNGRLIASPTQSTLARYRSRQKRYRQLRAEQKSLIPLASETLDGVHVDLLANVEIEEEFPVVRRNGAVGIGLFRTEVQLLDIGAFPSLEEQADTYSKVVDAIKPHPATFRLFDLGGDKVMPMADREQNPFLGWRGIRILLDRTTMLKTQLRAILHASARGPAKILLPMVTKIKEVRQFKAILGEVMNEMERSGEAFTRAIPVGVMIEVPSAALMIEDIACEVDFLSIGTNDLVQYVLAVDRGNDLVSHLFEELHPSILRLIDHILQAGRKHSVEVTVCGEMASHPRAVPVLLGLGLRHFSVSPAYLLEVKRIIRAISIKEAEAIADRALRLHEADEVAALVDGWLRKHACDPSQLLESLEAANNDRLVPHNDE